MPSLEPGPSHSPLWLRFYLERIRWAKKAMVCKNIFFFIILKIFSLKDNSKQTENMIILWTLFLRSETYDILLYLLLCSYLVKTYFRQWSTGHGLPTWSVYSQLPCALVWVRSKIGCVGGNSFYIVLCNRHY